MTDDAPAVHDQDPRPMTSLAEPTHVWIGGTRGGAARGGAARSRRGGRGPLAGGRARRAALGRGGGSLGARLPSNPLAWQIVKGDIACEQAGQIVPLAGETAVVLALGAQARPTGRIDLCGEPW